MPVWQSCVRDNDLGDVLDNSQVVRLRGRWGSYWQLAMGGRKSKNSLTHSFIHLLASIYQTSLCDKHHSGHCRYPGDQDTALFMELSGDTDNENGCSDISFPGSQYSAPHRCVEIVGAILP